MHCRMDFNIFMSKTGKRVMISVRMRASACGANTRKQLLVPRHSISPSGLHAIRTMSCAENCGVYQKVMDLNKRRPREVIKML